LVAHATFFRNACRIFIAGFIIFHKLFAAMEFAIPQWENRLMFSADNSYE
jgi:hypothetical protein